ncbi:DMT family transporter [Roseovarius rhodophyticola]|uniref:DMT family transporter n=1 Tax=Roseovarius rhodophyticola TaxID=3080827 RepID=A0ABZ2TL05_9RHOB|nr:DMT family transporter [Roseovarius sp. W115]MDV2928720.1 DMT family transporter [Roseovarius sp. W115]
MTSEQNARPGWGIFWMVVTGLQFVGVTALVKLLGTRIPAPEAAFLRYVLGLVFLIPMLGTLSRVRLDRGTLGLFAARGVAHSLGVGLWFFAMARIPIADVTAMNYLSPIYVTLGAAIFLGEKLALRRVLAIFVALIGALIILRPGFREVGPGHLAMIFTAIVFGASYLLAKMLSERCSPGLVVAMLSITVTIGLAPVALANWVTPTSYELLVLFGVAALATGGHYTMTLAFRAAPLAITQPVSFLQLVWAVALGLVVFGEPFDPWVILGGMVIVAAVSFISWREAILKRRAITPTVTQTKV